MLWGTNWADIVLIDYNNGQASISEPCMDGHRQQRSCVWVAAQPILKCRSLGLKFNLCDQKLVKYVHDSNTKQKSKKMSLLSLCTPKKQIMLFSSAHKQLCPTYHLPKQLTRQYHADSLFRILFGINCSQQANKQVMTQFEILNERERCTDRDTQKRNQSFNMKTKNKRN